MQSENWTFFREFIKAPKVVASVIPSSSFLKGRVIKAADLARAKVVVELGPGTGGLTRSLLEALGPQAHLLAIERTAEFAQLVEQIGDSRLEVVHGCASSIGAELSRRGFAAADAIVSGIPFSTMPRKLAKEVIAAVHAALCPGGRFVAYQVSYRVVDHARPVMGAPVIEGELRNVPPARVFTWRKTTQPRVNGHDVVESVAG